jgi:hypothetical protein
MGKACSFSPSIDATSDTFSLDNLGVLPDYDYTSLDSFFDIPVLPTNEPRKPHLGFADAWTTLAPLGVPEYKLPNAPANSPSNMTVDINDVFARHMSPTPSLCADGDDLSVHAPNSLKRSFPSSPSSSSPSSSLESTSGADDDDQYEKPAIKRPKRRPGLERTSSTLPTSSSSKTQQQRVPHNQVERKYREGLNTQLEQLRRAVPTLCQVNDRDRGKPSKATVLVGAMAYIKSIEMERDELAREVERRWMSAGAVRVEDWS